MLAQDISHHNFYYSDQLPVAIMETTLQLDGIPVADMFDDDLLLVWQAGYVILPVCHVAP